MRHTLSVLVENRTGVLARVAGLFSRRGFNIESLSVSTTDRKDISRMTIVVESAEDNTIEQVTKQLHKLVEVLKINDLSGENFIDRGLAMYKVTSTPETRGEIMQIVDIFRAHILDFSPTSMIIESTGSEKKIFAFEEALKPFGIKEVVRTGEIAMVRGINNKR